jgi:NTE family protein
MPLNAKRRFWTPAFAGLTALWMLGANVSAAPISPVASEDEFLLNVMWDAYRNLPKRQDPKIGVALGGGGARGLAHIGVLKVLEEENIPVNAIAGASVGALIGALYAAGISTTEMEEMSSEIGWSTLTNYTRMSMFRLVLTEQQLSSKNMESYLEKHMQGRRFDELKIPFACVATDLQTGERVVFREGPVAIAARASATIPGMFEPVVFRHRYLVDGGLVSNIPTDLVALMGVQTIIAVDVTSDLSRFQPENIIATLSQAISIQSEAMSQSELAKADFVIRPQLRDMTAMDLTRSAECIDAGSLAARHAVPTIKRLLVDRNLDSILRNERAIHEKV